MPVAVAVGKGQQSLAFEPWTDEDKERYQRLVGIQVTLKDTALGWQQEAFERHMVSKTATMSEEERQKMRKVLDAMDALV